MGLGTGRVVHHDHLVAVRRHRLLAQGVQLPVEPLRAVVSGEDD
jgi:hypothetical protein